MRAVITGGHGFVGRHLERHLRASGDEVLIIDRHGDHAVDITDGPAIAAKLADVAPDAVYHLAGWADVGASWRDPVGAVQANSEGPTHVLRAGLDAEVGLVLAVGSADLYGVVTADALPFPADYPSPPPNPTHPPNPPP